MSPADPAAIVAALRAVPGVSAARIEPSTDGGIGTLHLAMKEGTDETVVAKRVAELLRSGFGVGVDTDRVRLVDEPPAAAASPLTETPPPVAAPVVPPAPDEPPPAVAAHDTGAPAPAAPEPVEVARAPERVQPSPDEAAAPPRPVISRLRMRVSGLEVHCAVTLSVAGREVTGLAVGTANSSGTLRAVSGATLRAVEQLTAGVVRLEIEQLELTSVGSDSTLLVSLTMMSATGSSRLTGAAAVRQDVRQAAVRATLDAVNRRLGPLLGPRGGYTG
ncbi:MAG: hypothetical protein ACR2J0_04295 [Mycobacteriales bacterium]